MPIVPIRGLAQYGVITDVDAFNLPPQAFSMGVNVRFADGSISRGPVWRSVAELAGTEPRFVSVFTPSTSAASLVVGYLNGTVALWSAGNETDISITGYTPATADTKFTSTVLSGLLYVNREDRVPWYLAPSDSEMSVVPGWDSGWRVKIIRTCGSAIVGLNITDGATEYPNDLITSEFAEAGATPADFDYEDPSSNATRNTLAEMKGKIVDASNFGDSLCIYSKTETWFMTPDNSNDVFDYRPAPFNAGALATNCSISIDGMQYVFGPTDIWRHDGVSKQSIADGKVRRFIFRNMDAREQDRSFVTYNPNLNSVAFHFVSQDGYTGFLPANGTGCNRAAVFNLTNETWAFDDTPYVFGAELIEANSSVFTYATVTQAYDGMGGSYADAEDIAKRALVFAGNESTFYSLGNKLYAYDLDGPDSIVPFQTDEDATLGATLLREGIDLDELNAELRGYKLISSIYPQARLGDEAEPLEFSMGASDGFNKAPTYVAAQTYNGDDLYKLDFNTAGRYLALKMFHNDHKTFTLTGFDLDVEIIADR